MPKSAIPSDVPAPVTPEREVSSREQAMADIVRNRNEVFTEETGIEIDSDAGIDPDLDPDTSATEAARRALSAPADQLAEQLREPAHAADDNLASRKVRVKIDGVESEVTVEEMQREYQKGRTADKRLAEAADLRRQLDAEQVARPPTTAAAFDPAATKKFTSALFEGDEESAGNAFQEAVSSAVNKAVSTMGRGNATPAVDTAAIAQQVKQQMLIDSVLKQSRNDYPQMYADPDIEAMGAAKIQRSMNEGNTFEQALDSVSTELASTFNWSTSGRQSAPHSTTRNAKLERKAAIDNVTSINVKSSTTETAPMTNSQVIAEMAKQRGQTA